MIALGLRLAVGSGPARARLVLTTLGVAVGTFLLLAVLGYRHARDQEAIRAATRQMVSSPTTGPGLLWYPTWRNLPGDSIGQGYTLVFAAPGGPASPPPLGAREVPPVGSAYVSPSIDALLHSSTQGPFWRALVPWRIVGILGGEALETPDDRVVLVSVPASALTSSDVRHVRAFTAPADAGPLSSAEILATVSLTAAALTPILIFVGTVARIGQRRRDERAAALHLLGATARQLALVAAVETALGALAGALVAAVAVEGLRAVNRLSAFGYSAFGADMVATPWQVTLVVVLMPVLAATAAWISLVGVLRHPLATRRRARRRRAGIWRLAPAPAGWLVVDRVLGDYGSSTGNARLAALALGLGLMLVGVVTAGPLLLRHAAWPVSLIGKPAAVLANARIRHDATASFRAISGFAVAVTAASAILVYQSSRAATIDRELLQLRQATARSLPPATSEQMADVQILLGTDNATATTVAAVVRATPGVRESVLAGINDDQSLVGDCHAILRALHSSLACTTAGATSLGAAAIAPAIHDGAPGLGPAGAYLLLVTDGTLETVARISGGLELALPAQFIPINAPSTDVPVPDDRLERVLLLATFFVLIVATASLGVSTIDGVLERRRTLAHLAASGVGASTLRGANAIEVAAPMAAGLVLGLGVRIAIAATFVLEYLASAGPAVFAIPWSKVGLLAAGAVLATALVTAASLPVLGRATRPGQIRAE